MWVHSISIGNKHRSKMSTWKVQSERHCQHKTMESGSYHKTTTSYHTIQYKSISSISMLGLMTYLIFCIKWLAEETFITHQTLSALVLTSALCYRNKIHCHHEDSAAGLCCLCWTVWLSSCSPFSCSCSCACSLPCLLHNAVVSSYTDLVLR